LSKDNENTLPKDLDSDYSLPGLFEESNSVYFEAKPLFAVKFGEILDQPLDKVRKDLNIIPCTTGDYSWYTDPRFKNLSYES